MKRLFFKFLFCCFVTSLFVSCGGEVIDYEERLIGTWQITNLTEVMKSGKAYDYSADVLRKSTITFEQGGVLKAVVGTKEQTGTWSVSSDGQHLKLKADNVNFDENLELIFENKRAIIIVNQGREFLFNKVG